MGLLLLCLILVAGAGVGACASVTNDPASLPASNDYSWYEILVDADERFVIDEAADSARFTTASPSIVNQGFTRAQVWARFSIRYLPGSSTSIFLVLPKPLLDEVELISIDHEGRRRRMRAGDSQPLDARPNIYRAPAFELEPDPGNEVRYYLRVRSPTSAVSVPLRLMDGRAFAALVRAEDFALGGYFGVMCALAIAAILTFATFRRRLFLNYFFYIAAFTSMLAAVSGYGMQMLWPRAGILQQFLPTLLTALTMVAGVAFVRNFLNLANRWPTIDRAMIAVAGTGVAGALIHVVARTQAGTIIVIGGALMLCALTLLAFGRCVLGGDRIARYFLLGWLTCVVGIVATALDMYGLIPTSVVSAYGLYIGSFAEFVALSVALVDRLWVVSREKEAEIAQANAELAGLNLNLENIVRQRTRELEKRNDALTDLAIRDSLTGLYNHSSSIELLEQILNQSQRYEFAVTVLMVDVDNFKQVNDTFGHQAGDAVLEAVSRCLTESVRESDVVGRYGGEEFLIAMPHADVLAAREFGERLLNHVRGITIAQAPGWHLGVSVGIAVSSPPAQRAGAAELIKRADQALYRSKRSGRDRLTIDALSVVGGAVDPAAVAANLGTPR